MKNNAGFIPLGKRVLVKLPEISEKTDGGIIKTQDHISIEKAFCQKAIIIDKGAMAFQFELNGEIKEKPDAPKVGDMVRIIKGAGDVIQGNDDRTYKLLNDNDIIGKEIVNE